MKKRFTEGQIIGVLKQAEAGLPVKELCRQLDPHAYLKDVLQRLRTQRDSAIGELLPHRWKPALSR